MVGLPKKFLSGNKIKNIKNYYKKYNKKYRELNSEKIKKQRK